MTTSHKALLFDRAGFQRELDDLLTSCLDRDDAGGLVRFANGHVGSATGAYSLCLTVIFPPA